MEKRWQVKDKAKEDFLSQFPEIDDIVLQLLYNRDIKNQEAIDAFLSPNYDDHVLDPFLFNDMSKAVDRILSAVAKKEKVMIYGDYDADGISSSAIMYSGLKSLGLDVDVYIPFRDTEGYGLNKEAVQKIINQKFNLVITVDCGISNKNEIKMLSDAKIDVIITDHHQEPLERPEALAIINPSLDDSGYPFSRLCGAGVAFKVIQAITIRQEEVDSPVKLPAGFEKWLLDLTAVATVSDVMPLIGENRVFVKYGLMVLSKTKRIGLKAIIDRAKNGSWNKIDSKFIGWRLGPRLNAAGRVADASLAFNLLVNENSDEVEGLVDKLEKNNSSRQQITDKIQKEALEQITGHEEDYVLWAVGEDWPLGVVGLVAGRFIDRLHRPIFAVTRESDIYRGSGRSIVEFDIVAGLKECEQYLEKFGGHKQACGFTVKGEENFKKFQKKLNQVAKKKLKDLDLRPTLEIESEVELKDINWNLIGDIERFEPFGEGNPEPKFLARNLKIENIQTVGSDGNHLKAMVSQDGSSDLHKLIGFSFGEWHSKLNVGDKIDIVFEAGVNEWNGNRELQLKIIDMKMSE